MTTRPKAANIRLKRVQAAPERDDGVRVLVDRLWPRGLRKADVALDLWPKALAPSTALRQWFGHDPERWDEFRRRYVDELRAHREETEHLRALASDGTITLLFAAHDEAHNNAVALREFLLGRGAP